MALLDQLTADMKVAMKARDADKLTTIRLLIADLKKQELDAGPLDEAAELATLARQAKQRRESIDAYDAAGRAELAAKERAELAIITTYLPAQMSADDVRELAAKIIAEVGASSKADMGKVMGKLMPQLKGKFPGKDVRPIIDALLD